MGPAKMRWWDLRASVLILVMGAACDGGGGIDVSDGLQIVVTNRHRCVSRAGRVWCWGGDEYGQTGLGPPLANGIRATPQEVPNLTGVVELAASDGHTCARLANGRVKCWGVNGYGEVGPASAPTGTCHPFAFDAGPIETPCQPVPTEVPGVEGAVQLALNDQRSCARLATGPITCWGQVARGAEWLPTTGGAHDVALGDQAACVVSAAGTISCSPGQPGTLDAWTGISRVVMAIRSSLACALHANGAVDCWGENSAGQRGLGHTDPNIPFPGDPPAIAAGIAGVAVGWSHACALTTEGIVQCWGRNTYGAVGQSLSATATCSAGPCQLTPRAVDGLPPVARLAAGGFSTCALADDQRLFCWGEIVSAENDGNPTYVPGPWETL